MYFNQPSKERILRPNIKHKLLIFTRSETPPPFYEGKKLTYFSFKFIDIHSCYENYEKQDSLNLNISPQFWRKYIERKVNCTLTENKGKI